MTIKERDMIEQTKKFHAIKRALKSEDKDRVLELSREILTREREKQFHTHGQNNDIGNGLYMRLNDGQSFQVYECYIRQLEKELDEILLKYADSEESNRSA